jgi:hypothetical protein
MCTGFPRLGVLRRLRPARTDQLSVRPAPPDPQDADTRGKIRNGSRVHCGSLNEGGARLCPCGIAAGTPQPFPAASLAARAHHHGSSLPRSRAAGARRIQPRSTRFELAPHQGDVTRRFLAYSSPSRSPDPNHLAVLARPGFVRAAPTLPGTTRLRLPPASPPCCDRISGEGFSPPLEPQRLTAHARTAPHGRELGHRVRRGCEGRSADARPQERDHDARPVRPPLWRPTRCCCRCHGLGEGLSAFWCVPTVYHG